MDKPFGKLIRSDIFTFHIGAEKAPFAVHSVAIAAQSPALDALVNSNMIEAHSRTVTWPDVDADTFVRFCEFCYLNDYSPPSCQQANDNDERSEEIPDADRWSEPSDAQPESQREPEFFGQVVSSSKSKLKKRGKQAPVVQPLLSEKDYPLPDCCVQLDERLTTFSNVSADQDFTPVFLGHARLYVVADKYGIQPLKDLVLYKLYKTLKNFTFFATRIRDIIELIRFAYHDDNTRGRVDGIDGLRKLVTDSVVYWSDCITGHDDFLELLQEGGEFITDFWKVVRKAASFPLREQE
ncbi:uncharacterized protein GIQ15_01628 [Arthroderma uncinatum]|uniref:uncharacterized protein n=1 Tax=Arthroderma uncinatum TaxID=74035 RepID=UPI00144A8740|nr:uncharacterized protein GIQ15_01628 [Arthroderma uncinatum]KAF3492111.1 hypothetical protein GIQ15_01628 [Arthroderma uncinatum]